MDKIELKYNSWEDVPIKYANRVNDILKDDMLSEAERDIALIAVLCDVDESKVWELSIEEVIALRMKAMHTKGSGLPIALDKIVIGNWNLEIVKDVSKISYAQFVDFQSYIKDINANRAAILSVVLIPEGKKYNNDYDIQALINDINENISIHQFNVILNFFLQRLETSARHTLTSLLAWLRMKRMMTMKKEERNNYKEMERELHRYTLGLVSSGWL